MSGAGNNDLYTLVPGRLCKMSRSLGTAVGRGDGHFVWNSKFFQYRSRLSHDVNVGIAAHNDTDPRGPGAIFNFIAFSH
jgi:hypothetical protein